MYFERIIRQEILDLLQNQQDHRVIVLRQVGKTTLVKEIFKHLPGDRRTRRSLVRLRIQMGRKKVKPPKEWLAAYPESAYEVITLRNFIEFVL